MKRLVAVRCQVVKSLDIAALGLLAALGDTTRRVSRGIACVASQAFSHIGLVARTYSEGTDQSDSPNSARNSRSPCMIISGLFISIQLHFG